MTEKKESPQRSIGPKGDVMLRISKLADYGTVIMTFLASKPDALYAAKDIAEATHITLPTVSKILKILANGGLLQSIRGAKGGYSLARPAEEITITQIIKVLDGDLALTECSQHGEHCVLEPHCLISNNWQLINHAIYQALDEISLVDMVRPMPHNNLQTTSQTIKFVTRPTSQQTTKQNQPGVKDDERST